MRQYLDLLERVRYSGTRQKNRTGIDTFRIEGAMLQFDLSNGAFPALTTKKLAFKQVVGELLGFIEGASSAARFRELGCTIWDQNANENQQWLNNPSRKGTDDLGRIYGVQWRDWVGNNAVWVDQFAQAIWKIQNTPEDRRIIVSAWNPSELNKMALPPCHVMHQYICNPETKELSLCMYQRSCDMFLGVPFNIASYALLLEIVAEATGYVAKELIMFLADVHIYENHLEQVNEQLDRVPFSPPKLIMPLRGSMEAMEYIKLLTPEDFNLVGYEHHPPIKAPMAV